MPAGKRTTKAKQAVAQVVAQAAHGAALGVALGPSDTRRAALRRTVTILAAGFVIVCVVGGGLSAYHVAYAGKVFPGVVMDGIELAGLTQDQAAQVLREAWDAYNKQGIPLKVNETEVVLTGLVSSTTDPDLTYELIQFSPDEAAESAYVIGRRGNWLWRLAEPVAAAVGATGLAPAVSVDVERVTQYLRDTVPGVEYEPVPAQLTLDLAGNVQVVPERSGVVIEASRLVQDIQARASSLSREPVEVALQHVTPTLTEQKLAAALPEARRLMAQDTTVTLRFEDRTWTIEPETWRPWLGAREENGNVVFGFTNPAAQEFFSGIAKEVDQPAYDAKFEVQNGRVVAFQSSQPGRQVDVSAMVAGAEAAMRDSSAEPVGLIVAVTEPGVTTAETNDMGITELIGVGTSNFKGSPANRRHNIKIGAASLNGLIVKPDETFSLLAALGEIDATTGYLPELVIKGNKTIPEYGGGLCQIGTTTFRAALGSGLPIVERKNHSYRVVYYEPAGTDATIYDPAPDFKFRNDTGHNVLIQTKIEGDVLRFEFWGTKDGRQVTQTKPRIYNITAPPETKLVETEDLEPGVKKCTEKPHNGADTEFTYTVTYSDGRTEQEVFKSHYVPWQEVCLIGVPKGTLTPPEGEAPANAEGSSGTGAEPAPVAPEPAVPAVP